MSLTAHANTHARTHTRQHTCQLLSAQQVLSSLQMSQPMRVNVCLLVLPAMSLLLFSPVGRSDENVTLSPGCHLHRESRTAQPARKIRHAAQSNDLRFDLFHVSYRSASHLCISAFNVSIRSDQRGTCRGTHLAHACVGYCESSAFPSRYSVLVASNFTHNITSASRCCTIAKEAKVKVRLECPGGRHHDELEILTAKACRCDMCRTSRY
ncbi:glycoprotein hormone alpha-2 isoform X1 [Hippocampus comes]|uniref:glycoprotein hormone alpha-2 isoform X1 n=1 Tax=Hippocampus comes TaxID=109280 RepID=UPI00094E26BC|nr:PREDICTED: glycoprotein hormone alpha-2 isoform X1 [Hippocampus comes]